MKSSGRKRVTEVIANSFVGKLPEILYLSYSGDIYSKVDRADKKANT